MRGCSIKWFSVRKVKLKVLRVCLGQQLHIVIELIEKLSLSIWNSAGSAASLHSFYFRVMVWLCIAIITKE